MVKYTEVNTMMSTTYFQIERAMEPERKEGERERKEGEREW